MGKQCNLKYGLRDVLPRCFRNSDGKGGFGRKGMGSSFKSPKELCVCVPAHALCVCAQLCESITTDSACFWEFKGIGPLKWWVPAQAFWHKHPCIKNRALMDPAYFYVCACMCVLMHVFICVSVIGSHHEDSESYSVLSIPSMVNQCRLEFHHIRPLYKNVQLFSAHWVISIVGMLILPNVCNCGQSCNC